MSAGGRIVGVEGCDALRIELECCLLEAFGIAPGQDDAGALGAGAPGGFQADASAAADDDDGLAAQFRFALNGYASGCSCHCFPGGMPGEVRHMPTMQRSEVDARRVRRPSSQFTTQIERGICQHRLKVRILRSSDAWRMRLSGAGEAKLAHPNTSAAKMSPCPSDNESGSRATIR